MASESGKGMTMFKSLFRKFVKAPGRTASKSDLMSHPPVQVKTDPPERKGESKVALVKAASVVKTGRNQLVTFGFLVLIVLLIGIRGSNVRSRRLRRDGLSRWNFRLRQQFFLAAFLHGNEFYRFFGCV